MKKRYIIIFIVLILFLILTLLIFFKCKFNYTFDNNIVFEEDKNVKINILDDTITPTGLTIFVIDNSTEGYEFGGLDYRIQKKHGKTWKYINKHTLEPIITSAYSLKIRYQKAIPFDWNFQYGNLKKGTYRIIIKTSYPKKDNVYFLTEEFIIK